MCGEDSRRYRTLRRVGPVLDVDQPADHRERVLQIDAVAVGNFCRGGNADGSGLGAGNRCSAKFGQGVEKFAGHFVRNKRGDEGRLLQLVDGILDLIHQTFDAASGIESRNFTSRLDSEAVGFLLDTPCALGKRRAVEGTLRPPFGNQMRKIGGDLMRQAGLADHGSQQRSVDALQMRDKRRLNPVPRQPHRASL